MLKLLTQHIKLILLLVAFGIYVALELSLNLLLIELYAKPLEMVFGDLYITAERLELFGRTLSGFGLALAIVSFIPNQLFNGLQGINSETADASAKTKWLYRPVVFLVLWALIIPMLRVTVDSVVNTTSNTGKLSAVRAIVYKEAYLAKAVSIEGFPEFDNIVNDPQQRDLMVALIPSLAYFSSGFNTLIESNLENMADTFLSNRQQLAFVSEAIPNIRAFDSVFKQELAAYQKASQAYEIALAKENNFALIDKERVELLNLANVRITQHWQRFADELLKASNFRDEYATNTQIVEVYRDIREKARSSRCKGSCQAAYKTQFADYMNTLTFESSEPFGIFLNPEDVSFSKILKSKYNLRAMFSTGRANYLYKKFGIPEQMEYEQYNTSASAKAVAIKVFKEHQVNIDDSWQYNDMRTLHDAIAAKYQGKAKAQWQAYVQQSRFKISVPSLDRIDFSRSKQVKDTAKRMLGEYYLPAFTPNISESRYQTLWLDSQDNISFIKMVTSTAATAAFSPGGSMFTLGQDAVKLAVIPPVSIAASLLSIFLLFLKLGLYLFSRNRAYFAVAMLAGTFAFVMPVAKAVANPNAYHTMMAKFASEFSDTQGFDKAFTLGFGYVLDIESGVYQTYRDIDFVGSVYQTIRYRPPINEQQSGETISDKAAHDTNLLRQYDNTAYNWLYFVPEMLGVGKTIAPFTSNITVLKQNMNVGAYLGVRIENEKVSSVKMPNFMQGSDIGLIAQQRFLHQPNWGKLAFEYVSNINEPAYWLKLAEGNIAKESIINRLERNMAVYINNNKHTLALLNQLKAEQQSNLILLKQENSERYRCFVLGNVTAKLLSDSIKARFFDYTELPDCKATL